VLRAWSSTGYGEPITPDDTSRVVALLTPPSIVETIRHGYPVQWQRNQVNRR
jgi:hypothetical protein